MTHDLDVGGMYQIIKAFDHLMWSREHKLLDHSLTVVNVEHMSIDAMVAWLRSLMHVKQYLNNWNYFFDKISVEVFERRKYPHPDLLRGLSKRDDMEEETEQQFVSWIEKITDAQSETYSQEELSQGTSLGGFNWKWDEDPQNKCFEFTLASA